MNKYVTEYIKMKYIVAFAVNTFLSIVGLLLIDYVYPLVGLYVDTTVNLSVGVIIALAILGYVIGYMHERIPHCSSPIFSSIVRYTGMVLLLTAPIFYIVMMPNTLYEWFYFGDAIFSIAGIPAIATVIIMYKFAKKGSKPTMTCSL